MTTANRVRGITALPILALAVVACAFLPDGLETSTMVIVNKTTVPVSAEDDGSRRIVDPCSERTIEYHGTWGGDPESSMPYAEPAPPDAYSISLDSQFTRPFENAIHQRILVNTQGAQTVGPDRDLRSEPCVGIPPRTGTLWRH
jgi:hypothetical protein